jgi:leucyl aminopeptidase
MVKQGIGLRFNDMPTRLPLDQLMTPVRSVAGRVSAARLARYPVAILLLPPVPSAADWSLLPHADLLRQLCGRKRRKAGESLCVRLGRGAETVLHLGFIGPKASVFEQLQAAGKLARAALESLAGIRSDGAHPLILWSQGCEDAASAQCAVVAALQAAAFPLASFKSEPAARAKLGALDIAGRGKLPDLDLVLATAAGNNLARWLTALPPNRLDAAAYRRCLKDFARRLKLRYRFYGEPQLKRLGAGAFLAVSRGNAARDAGIVCLSYRPRGPKAPDLSLVGKGICFDTGGTNLKTHKSMLDMHTDMEGSAVAVGSLFALHALASPLAVDCWLAITENRIGPLAYKPQDVVRAMNGTTIQVIHTDAEGRMVLADALCLAAARKPKAIIDYATLTGACVYALTERYSGAFTNRPDARAAIEAAGTSSGERVWCFPMDADFDTDLDSAVADVLQCATEGKGDHILAARFLNRFVPSGIPWLHLDLAAGTRHGGLAHIGTDVTGFGVRYTVALLRGGWPPPERA